MKSHIILLFNINKKEIFQLRIMRYVYYYLFGLTTLILFITDYLTQKISFSKLSIFLEQNLFFNQTKIILAVLYTLSVNKRLYIGRRKTTGPDCRNIESCRWNTIFD